MSKQLFPAAIITDSYELYYAKISATKKIIYGFALFFIFCTLISLPFIYVPISICSLGIIQSKKERCNITIPINGTIQNIAIINNQKIKKGDTLLQIDATPVNIEIDFNEKNIHQLNSQLNDLNNLAKYTVENAYTYIPTIRNEQYISVKNQFEKEMQAQQDKLYYLQNSEQRQTILYQKKINAKVDLEKATYEYTFAQNEYKIFIERQVNIWKAEVQKIEFTIQEVKIKLQSLYQQKKLYTIEATTDGAVQELQGLQNGNYVFSNQRIATLSPDSTIIATCFVSSKDIGLIKINQRVFLQIDAYNYREWNTAKAQVIEISEDAVADDKNKSTYFIVKCKLLNNQLKLKNGYVGKIKKGMTFNARFFITQRNLYELLFDNIDDWLNPTTKQN